MKLPQELRDLVHQSVALLGDVIKRELGQKAFEQIENLRSDMADLREVSDEVSFEKLKKSYVMLEKLNSKQRLDVARAFTLMLELMNACENAYRSFRLGARTLQTDSAQTVHYVLTAHPTEARSPQNIAVFHEIQNKLAHILGSEQKFTEEDNDTLLHLLEIAWRAPIVRDRSPKVKDEAEHIYSMLFREGVLLSLLKRNKFWISSWVGGDKDGHPGVDEKTMLESLTLSRKHLLDLIFQTLRRVQQTLQLFPSEKLQKSIHLMGRTLHSIRTITASDARKVLTFKKALQILNRDYVQIIGHLHPDIQNLNQLVESFPGLVVPLELRESSEILMISPAKRKSLPIYKMLQMSEKISRGGNPRWYTRGFIISMTESAEHLKVAAQFQKAVFGWVLLPIIPLFEEASSLKISDQIMSEVFKDPLLKKSLHDHWNNQMEMMVGYSDSSKEAGVLPSRLAIAEALPRLEKVCEKAGVTPIFFHGSGGSIDRGGGSIEDQTAWWPKSALRYYKVTIQGEMVERSFATPNIALRQVETIVDSATQGLKKPVPGPHNSALDQFAQSISSYYHKTITSENFLKRVEAATPYSYLSVLKIGSRPVKRTTELTVKGLRAIPWILCWTQTRVLFPTWWGVGSAWKKADENQKKALKKAFHDEPVFTSYVKALGFTLAKVELSIWRLYLEHSQLTAEEIRQAYNEFKQEYDLTLKCYFDICVQNELLWFRPWLGESIQLRSPMIHPLNLLQILAQKNKDPQLLRVSVTGISSGMLTTG